MRRAAWLLALALGCAHVLRGADPAVGVVLPRDRAAHADAQTEWWHFHGHLVDAAGRRYDWFLAFIRQHTDLDSLALVPVRWFVNPFNAAYFTLTDRAAHTFTVRERYSWPDFWAAGAAEDRLSLYHDDWRVEASAPDASAMRVEAGSPRGALALQLRATTPPVLQGHNGYVAFPPDSSHDWEELPRLTATGTLTVDGAPRAVTGTAWYKHEWGFLYSDRVAGFVYLGLQLSSGAELEIAMVFDRDWAMQPGSFAAVVEASGAVKPLDLHAVDLRESGETWRSPRTDTVYPMGWSLDIPERQATLTLRAVENAQEMVVLPANLWAGTLAVTGAFDGEEITGSCFSELAGFQRPFGRALFHSGRPVEGPR